ncbi:MAG: ABC transporter substrate-binding protein [Defluviitaleaceae bacterium]|nr:ABC transporter substrate-binding protein [Defluviitaleaceae bacterium]
MAASRGETIERLKALLITILIVVIVVWLVLGRSRDPHQLQIAAANDLAGVIVNASAGVTPGTRGLMLADCCGNHTEIALSAGVFDMAVLCPDAAELFLQANDSFFIVGGLVRNTNVLVSTSPNSPLVVGYTEGRASQREAARAFLGEDVRFMPVITLALPNALATGAVCAVILDIYAAVNIPEEFYMTPLPHYGYSSVLVVCMYAAQTEAFRDFVNSFNDFIASDEVDKWKDLGVRFSRLY